MLSVSSLCKLCSIQSKYFSSLNAIITSNLSFQKHYSLDNSPEKNDVVRSEHSTDVFDTADGYMQIINNKTYMTKVILSGKIIGKPLYYDNDFGKYFCFSLLTRHKLLDQPESDPCNVTYHHLTCFKPQYFEDITKAAESESYINISGNLQRLLPSLKKDLTININSLKLLKKSEIK